MPAAVKIVVIDLVNLKNLLVFPLLLIEEHETESFRATYGGVVPHTEVTPWKLYR
jgi:hypothetical protein